MAELNRIDVPKFDGDPYEVALQLVDRLFKHLPTYGKIELSKVISSSDLTDEEKRIARHLSDKIDYFLKDKFHYVSPPEFKGYFGELTDFGRYVKQIGGHAAYVRIQEEEAERIRRREELEDEKLPHEVRIAAFDANAGSRIRKKSYYIAVMGVLISIAGSILIPLWIYSKSQNEYEVSTLLQAREIDSLRKEIAEMRKAFATYKSSTDTLKLKRDVDTVRSAP